MMNSLNGLLNPSEADIVRNLVPIRFARASDFITPESLIIYEQNILPEDMLHKVCEEEYQMTLEKPSISYLSTEIIMFFMKHLCVPYKMDNINDEVHVMTIPEYYNLVTPNYKHFKTVKHRVTLYTFVKEYTKHYGNPTFLNEIADKDVLEYMISEAIQLEASDITITSRETKAEVYYDVRKKKVYSRRSITKENVERLAEIIAMNAGAKYESTDIDPQYMTVDLDGRHRGRTVINRTYWGRMISIRVLSNDFLDCTLEDLNIESNTRNFMREEFYNDEGGLRLFVGKTSSGKNTSMLSGFKEVVIDPDFTKPVSIEKPVELLVDGMEQIEVETEDEYKKNVDSLLRMNPGYCYLSEITATTAEAILTASNTDCAIFSTLHANSPGGVVSRLVDLTKLSPDRILSSLHSVIFQRLERIEEKDILLPKTRYLRITEELKIDLYGKSLSEISVALNSKVIEGFRGN